MRCKKGQSILEYVIVLTVIVAAIALFASQALKPAINQALSSSAGSIKGAVARLPGANTN
jgi:uncharacterized protein YpmB